MKKIALIVALIVSLLSPFALSPLSVSVSADAFSSSEAKKQACVGINGCTTAGTIDNVIHAILNILSVIAGVAAVIMVMISGFKYMTAAGDGGKIASAKNTLVYAIVGVIIVAMSQFIAQYVIKEVTTTTKKKKAAIVLNLT